MPDETKVLVIPRAAMDEVLGEFQGFKPVADESLIRQLIATAKPFYMDRPQAENDPTYKQIIPYVTYRVGSDTGPELFSYARTKKGEESRLHDKLSIGIGGHINPTDEPGEVPDAFWAFQQAMIREAAEEVDVNTSTISSSILGLINEDETEVGRVHLGVSYLIHLARPLVTLKEDTAREGRFRNFKLLEENRPRFEKWTGFVFDYLVSQQK